jgi:hypothetical protein
MRSHVTFRHPAEFVPVSEDEGILSAAGVSWFLKLLAGVKDIDAIGDPLQEDWGVVVFAGRRKCRFWIGINSWDEGAWLVHFHHHSFAWLQRMTSNGKKELGELVSDFHNVLESDEQVRDVSWHYESDMTKPDMPGASTPDASKTT